MRLIDANALKNAIRAESWKEDNTVKMAVDYINILIDEQPTINPDDLRPHGRWEEIRNDYGELEGWIHVDCGRESKSKDKYCGTCGAKMDGKENEDA